MTCDRSPPAPSVKTRSSSPLPQLLDKEANRGRHEKSAYEKFLDKYFRPPPGDERVRTCCGAIVVDDELADFGWMGTALAILEVHARDTATTKQTHARMVSRANPLPEPW